MKTALGVDAKLIAGGGGIFDVTVDGTRLYCKHETDRFPNEGEVLGLIRDRA